MSFIGRGGFWGALRQSPVHRCYRNCREQTLKCVHVCAHILKYQIMYICELRQVAVANLINSFGSLDSFYLQQQEVFIFTILREAHCYEKTWVQVCLWTELD